MGKIDDAKYTFNRLKATMKLKHDHGMITDEEYHAFLMDQDKIQDVLKN